MKAERVPSTEVPGLKPRTLVRGTSNVLRTLATYVLPPAIALAAVLAFWEWYIAWKDVSIIVMPARVERGLGGNSVAERCVSLSELKATPGLVGEQATVHALQPLL